MDATRDFSADDAIDREDRPGHAADFPPSPSPVYVRYPHSRQLSPRERVFIDWLAAEFAAQRPPVDNS